MGYDPTRSNFTTEVHRAAANLDEAIEEVASKLADGFQLADLAEIPGAAIKTHQVITWIASAPSKKERVKRAFQLVSAIALDNWDQFGDAIPE